MFRALLVGGKKTRFMKASHFLRLEAPRPPGLFAEVLWVRLSKADTSELEVTPPPPVNIINSLISCHEQYKYTGGLHV